MLTGGSEPERVPVEWVSAGYFELLGINPVLGRAIREDEDRVGSAASQVAVIGEGVWKRRFGGDPGVLGKQLQLKPTALYGHRHRARMVSRHLR